MFGFRDKLTSRTGGQLKDGLFFDRDNLKSQRIGDRKLQKWMSVESTFVDCLFEQLTIAEMCMGGGGVDSFYSNCRFKDVTIRSSAFGYARLEQCHFENITLVGVRAYGCEFVNCSFTGRLADLSFYGDIPGDVPATIAARRTRNEFAGNDFHLSAFDRVEFRGGIDLSLQSLPVADNVAVISDVGSAVARARQIVASWKTEGDRLDALAILNVVEEIGVEGRNQAFLESAMFSSLNARVSAELFDLLRSPIP